VFSATGSPPHVAEAGGGNVGKQSYGVGIQYDLRPSGMLRRVHWYVVIYAWWRGEVVARLSAQHITGLAFERRNNQE